ncbi:GNAT family N-acetyltransferase [bacterium]|nr:GNAT family N-acetyltransferase [bacterium]
MAQTDSRNFGFDSRTLADGRALEIRPAKPSDAPALIAYVEEVCAESDNLTFGPGEFGMTLSQEMDFLRAVAAADNQVYLLGLVGGRIVAALNFAGGKRPRTRHSGEFGISVRREFWGLGASSAMLDALVAWAGRGGIVRKIGLRVRTDNERAIALYERKGFVREGTLRAELAVGDVLYDLHAMALFL